MSQENRRMGRFYGVGVGPGDPELITLKAQRVLSQVPVIFVPKKGMESSSHARSIIAGFVSDRQQVVELVFPMVREREKLTPFWQEAAERVWSCLKRGDDCAFVNLGDPLLYGTFIPVVETLLRNHPEAEVESIPGISSVFAAASETLVPLAIDNERVAIMSGRTDDSLTRQVLSTFDTVVFMKIHSTFDHLLGILREMDMVKNCVYVERGTTRREKIVRDVSRLKGEKLDYFSLLIFRR